MILLTLILISLLIPNISNAQKYVPLVVDQIDQFNDLQNTTDFGTFLNGLFLFGLAIAAVLAVVMIIYGGVLYMGSESVFNKGEGKSKIQAAIGGLILALVSWLILNTINPDIISSTGRFEPSPVTLPEGDFGAGISGNFEPVQGGGTNSNYRGTQTDQEITDYLKGSSGEWDDNSNPQIEGLSAVSGVILKDGASLVGVRQDSLIGVRNLKIASGVTTPITITSGTDGKHATGTYSHANGYKLDIGGRGGASTNPQFDAWMTSTIRSQIGSNPQNDTNYNITINGQKMIVRPESNHWDITFGKAN